MGKMNMFFAPKKKYPSKYFTVVNTLIYNLAHYIK